MVYIYSFCSLFNSVPSDTMRRTVTASSNKIFTRVVITWFSLLCVTFWPNVSYEFARTATPVPTNRRCDNDTSDDCYEMYAWSGFSIEWRNNCEQNARTLSRNSFNVMYLSWKRLSRWWDVVAGSTWRWWSLWCDVMWCDLTRCWLTVHWRSARCTWKTAACTAVRPRTVAVRNAPRSTFTSQVRACHVCLVRPVCLRLLMTTGAIATVSYRGCWCSPQGDYYNFQSHHRVIA